MFNTLAQKLSAVFDKLSNRGILTESAVDDSLRAIKVALLEADVALPVVKTFIQNMRDQVVGEKVVKAVSPSQMVVKLVHDELVKTLGESRALNLTPRRRNVILMLGLQGSGKTTTSAKLALRLQKSGAKVLLASLDTYRPAAQEQLAELGLKNNLAVLPIIKNEKPLDIARRALHEAELTAVDALILDTAGRLHIDAEMMAELAAIKRLSDPAESLLVADAMMGQDAVTTAQTFADKIGLTGIVLTRVDGDARGGAALSMRAQTGVPLLFLGVGEKADALEAFDAKRIAGRILGMGDVVGLVETAIEKVNQDEAQKTAERMLSGRFDLNDLLSQMRQINKLGDVKGLMKMIPGIAKFSDQIDKTDISNKTIRRQEAVILSMTPRERKNPDILKASRKLRIAAGAGVSVNDVNRLLKQYEQTAAMMKQFKKMGPTGMMSLMKKMGGMPGMDSLMNNDALASLNPELTLKGKK